MLLFGSLNIFFDKKFQNFQKFQTCLFQVFTPPTDSESVDSPHSTVKRQLRARRSKKI